MKNFMKKNWQIMGLMSLILTGAIASGVPQQWATDLLKFGVGASSDNKVLEFNTGDGVANPKITVDISDNSFNFSEAVKVASTLLEVGNGTNVEKIIEFDVGLGAANPKFRWNSTDGRLEFSNDGVLFKAIGSGSGTGNGINEIANGGFEDGVTSEWVNSGGTLAELDLDADKGLGEKSARFTSSASGQYYETVNTTFSNVVADGLGCSADFFYKSGADFEVKIFKEDLPSNPGTFLEVTTETIPAQTSWTKFPLINFFCSSNMKIRFESTAASVIDLDQVYLGSNKSLVDVDTPNVFAAVISNNGTAAITSQSSNFIQSVVRTTTGRVTVTFIPGFFTVAPAVSIGCFDSMCTDHQANTNSVTASGFNVITESSNLGTDFDLGFSVVVQKQGADSNQVKAFSPDSASFYISASIGGAGVSQGATSTPIMPINSGLSMTLNRGSALIACSGTEVASGLTCSGTEGLGISFNAPVGGFYEACFSFGVASGGGNHSGIRLVETPNNAQTITQQGNAIIQLTNASNVPGYICETFNLSPGQRTIRLMVESAAGTSFELSGLAFSYETDMHVTVELKKNYVSQPVVINQLSTSIISGLQVETCRINNTGVATIDTQSQTCDWITSVNRPSIGLTTVNYGGAFANVPVCVVQLHHPIQNTHDIAFFLNPTLTSFQTHVTVGNTTVDAGFHIICMAKR